jgi:hypothetical protein
MQFYLQPNITLTANVTESMHVPCTKVLPNLPVLMECGTCCKVLPNLLARMDFGTRTQVLRIQLVQVEWWEMQISSIISLVCMPFELVYPEMARAEIALQVNRWTMCPKCPGQFHPYHK